MTEAEAVKLAEALYDELDQGEFDENVPEAELRAWAVGKMAAAILAASRPGEGKHDERGGKGLPRYVAAGMFVVDTYAGHPDEPDCPKHIATFHDAVAMRWALMKMNAPYSTREAASAAKGVGDGR